MNRRGTRTAPVSWTAEALVLLPARASSPARELLRRAGIGVLLLAIIVAIVYLDRGAYTDSHDGEVNFIDSLYYATVTMTTTGYGDITPTAPHARLINAIVVTPLRIMFLVLLVGTTLEVLANEGRRIFRDSRWRRRMRNHVVVIGYGTKGRSAVTTMRRNDLDLSKVVVIDSSPTALADANRDGVAALEGDATRRELLQRAEISKAREIVITLNRDDAAILATLTARRLNPSAHVVVAVREHDNVSLLRQSGADAVVTSSDAVGRLLGLSAVSPNLGNVIEDVLTSGEGLEVSQRMVTAAEVGGPPMGTKDERVVAVVRNKTLRRFYDPAVQELQTGDEVVVIRQAPEE